ncbi:MAG TPA: tRNA (adenosine(37)-N6)-threonylcarbamoyltransferase complex dimerization subunit type 1 TsaB [Burkholderiales bacterium]|nr:tRNA (adenosine(37)-N6)-threonylcarbamoyltransferase complex dimerization subunit type 1 TsaB [Burkholderiales bacterium]
MRFASLETSSEWCSVALHVDGELRALERRAGQRHSELALPMLHFLLKTFGLRSADLDAVAFGAGPGSFTGLRIACGLAQGLALARGLPVLGVSSLEAIAEESGARRVVACLDARMREVYYAALEKEAHGWREAIAARCVAPQAAPRPAGEGWVGCGSGFALEHRWDDTLGAMKRFPEIHATASAIARLAAPRLARGEGVDAADAAPRYLRDKVAFTREELKRR